MRKTEFNHDIKMIFFDIDDTLRVKDTEFMPASVPLAIKKLHEKGIAIGIASGRAIYGFAPEIMALNPDYFVTINGQVVMDKEHNTVFKNPIACEDIDMVIAWAKARNLDYGFVGKDECAVSSWSELVADAMTVVYGKIQEDPNFHEKHEVFQMWTYSANQEEDTLPAELLEHVKVVRWHDHSCDIFPNTGSKAVGIHAVLEAKGLTKDNIMVFGDGNNDLEMFQFAGYAVAMGNAVAELKEHADYITKDILEDGIFFALQDLGIID